MQKYEKLNQVSISKECNVLSLSQSLSFKLFLKTQIVQNRLWCLLLPKLQAVIELSCLAICPAFLNDYN